MIQIKAFLFIAIAYGLAWLVESLVSHFKGLPYSDARCALNFASCIGVSLFLQIARMKEAK